MADPPATAGQVPPLALDDGSRRWCLAAAGACLLPLLLQLPAALAWSMATVALLVGGSSLRRRLPGIVRLLLALALVGAVLTASRFHFGRDTACALLAAMLAIKPGETSTLRDGRSLIGFALFAPFATFLLDQGPLSLALALAGATLALAALLRLAELESGEAPSSPPIWQRLALVLRLAAIGLPLALATFWMFPRLASPLWGVPERAIARPGLSDHMEPGAFSDVLTDDTPALRVQFHGAPPQQSQMYWRGPVLWDFDGRRWTQPSWLRGLPPAPVAPAAGHWDYQLEFEPTDRRQLVALDLPRGAPPGSRLTIDYGLYSDKPLTALTRWHVRSAAPTTFEPRLAGVLRSLALALPAGYNPRTLALARQWRLDAGPSSAASDLAIAQRAMRMIRADFAYTLAVPLPGRHAVDEFLFEQKAGYCEQFSSAFVVLMRAAGIPARVVTGYVGGYRNRFGGYWLVRRSDAHAWAEAWLPGRGWTRFDPTAAVAPGRIYDTLADRGPGARGLLDGLGRLAPIWDAGDWMRRGWNDFVLGFDAARQQRLLQPLGIDDLGRARLLALFGAAAGLAVLWMLWLSARAEREADPVLRAWRELTARYARLGLARFPHEPASRWAERVRLERPDLAPGLLLLIQRFIKWRYAGGQAGGRQAAALVRDLRRHRPARRVPAGDSTGRIRPTDHGEST